MPHPARLLLTVLGLSLSAAASHVTQAQSAPIQVTLLGTGTPRPSLERFGPSILVEAGGLKFVFDVGRGATQRLAQLNVPFPAITGVFLTHLHSDHVVGLPDLWLTGWLVGNRTLPLRLWGPAGTVDMARHLEAAFTFDVQIRIADDKAPASGGLLAATDVGEGPVYDSDGVVVTAFLVDHGPVRPALGYRLDYRGHSVVLSGDTRPSANLIAHAVGVDLLIHEVSAATAADIAANPATRRVLAHHSSPLEAAEVFTRTHPALAVYSHIGLRGGLTAADLLALTRTGYSGPLMVGADLMHIAVGDSVTVTSLQP
jgi:ribonuclease Z